jgi:hypothetical protein
MIGGHLNRRSLCFLVARSVLPSLSVAAPEREARQDRVQEQGKNQRPCPPPSSLLSQSVHIA